MVYTVPRVITQMVVWDFRIMATRVVYRGGVVYKMGCGIHCHTWYDTVLPGIKFHTCCTKLARTAADVLALTRMIKFVVTGQAPVGLDMTCGMEQYPRRKIIACCKTAG